MTITYEQIKELEMGASASTIKAHPLGDGRHPGVYLVVVRPVDFTFLFLCINV